MPAPVDYSLTVHQPERHLFALELTLESDRDVLHFSLPDWVPGSYMIRDYARHIVTVRATVDGRDQPLEKLGKSRWQLSGAVGSVCVAYEVYAFDRSVRGAYIDRLGWFCQGVCVFLCCEEAQDETHRVIVDSNSLGSDWSLATAMPAESVSANGSGQYINATYRELIDHPLMAGLLTRIPFTVFGVPHEIVLAGRCDVDAQRLARDLAAVCEAHVQFFGEPPPMRQYLFLTRVGGDKAGGLEHRDSSALSVPRKQIAATATRADYLDFLSLASHEYFHAWLVKRIRPSALADAPLDCEAHTQLLWVFEGITSYYDELGLLRAGILQPDEYLSRLGALLSRVQRGAGRLKQSLAESSFDTWTRFYKQDENAPNAIVSYYSKGALVALCLDLTLRQRSDGQLTLDAVMRNLWQRYGGDETLPESGFESLVNELAEDDLGPFFDQAVRGCDDLPCDLFLAAQGVSLKWLSSEGDAPWLGCTFSPGSNRIAVVYEDSPAQLAGLAPRDEVVAWQGLRFDAEDQQASRLAAGVGNHVDVTVFREDELHTVSVALAPPIQGQCVLESKPGFEQTRDQWLYGHA